jgi:PAS domain S-box-containing protein
MIEPPVPANESARLNALRGLHLLDTPIEERFERITRIATRTFNMPIALVSLVDADRQWIKSCQGWQLPETPRSISFCGHAILQDQALVIPDAWLDPRFEDNPLVRADPHIRFYAGQPLSTSDGSRIGTLCLIDRRPRDFSADDRQSLRDLAYWVERELETAQLSDALDAVQTTEMRYRSVIAALSEGIVLQDANGTIHAWNESAERILGLSAEQIMGRTSFDPRWQAIHEDGSPFPAETHPTVVTLSTGQSCNDVVMGVYQPDGALKWLSVNSYAMFDTGASEVSAVVCSFADITERKQAEAALRATEQRFRTLVEQLPAITYVAALDAESSTLYTSPQIETMLGFSQAEWMTDHTLWRKQVHPDDYTRVMADIEQSQATGAPVPSEYRMITRSGRSRWFRDQAVVVHDPAGQPLFMQGIMFDITERKLAEAALRASEARQRALLDAMPDAIFRLSRDGVFLDVRADKASDLLLPPDMLLGRRLFDALPADVARQFIASIEQALWTTSVQLIEYQLALEHMVRDFEARVVVCADNEVLAIVRDITESKNIERLKNEFVSTVSHELRTPLTSIRGAIGLILGGVAGDIPLKARVMMEIASRNSDRLIRLINDILDIDKIESGKMIFNLQPVELMPLLEQVIDINRPYGQQFDITFKLENPLDGAWVYADGDRLTQALTNLLSNAAKFSSPGARVRISLARLGATLRIAIHDRGPGIPEAFRERLFQKFAQVDASDARQKGGTGLGLSITKAIVEKLGGQIGVTIVPDVGNVFFIDLPEWYILDLAQASAGMLDRQATPREDARPESFGNLPGAD